jgi:signal transduction histidine kinase
VELNVLIDECVDLMRERAAERSLRIAVELSGPEHFIADRRAMKQILLNLLSNAIKFTPAGGKVTVATKMENDRLVLSVADTGIGIPADALPHVFEKFFRVPGQSKGAGTGLGLAIVQEIVVAHGGTIACESRPGKGTEFRIRLPALRESSAGRYQPSLKAVS